MVSLCDALCLTATLLSTRCNAQATLDLDLSNLNFSDVGAGPYPKFPDVLECDNHYGEGLNSLKCLDAMDELFHGLPFIQNVSHKQCPEQSAFVVPQFYYDYGILSEVFFLSRSATFLTIAFNSASFLRHHRRPS